MFSILSYPLWYALHIIWSVTFFLDFLLVLLVLSHIFPHRRFLVLSFCSPALCNLLFNIHTLPCFKLFRMPFNREWSHTYRTIYNLWCIYNVNRLSQCMLYERAPSILIPLENHMSSISSSPNPFVTLNAFHTTQLLEMIDFYATSNPNTR